MTEGIIGSVLVLNATRLLKSAGVPDAARDARRLFSHAMGVDASRLTLTLPEPVATEDAAVFAALISRRQNREPVSHLTGKRAFYGRDFAVTPDVLDPRPETEMLIEVALQSHFTKMVDLGTGSGCILVTLLAEVPCGQGIGVDLSLPALAVAARNARTHGVADRASFHCADWLDGINGPFDLIVANPPYIAVAEMADLSPEVVQFEPQMALTDFADGLTHYRRIVTQAVPLLLPDGRLIVEIGPTQGDAVSQMMTQAGLCHVTVTTDLDGRDRVVSAQLAGFTPEKRG
ncbi:MAG: release factor glutamine methyltransferase [Yoonia sp.]